MMEFSGKTWKLFLFRATNSISLESKRGENHRFKCIPAALHLNQIWKVFFLRVMLSKQKTDLVCENVNVTSIRNKLNALHGKMSIIFRVFFSDRCIGQHIHIHTYKHKLMLR